MPPWLSGQWQSVSVWLKVTVWEAVLSPHIYLEKHQNGRSVSTLLACTRLWKMEIVCIFKKNILNFWHGLKLDWSRCKCSCFRCFYFEVRTFILILKSVTTVNLTQETHLWKLGNFEFMYLLLYLFTKYIMTEEMFPSKHLAKNEKICVEEITRHVCCWLRCRLKWLIIVQADVVLYLFVWSFSSMVFN